MRRGIKFQVVRILAGFALAAMLATNLAAQGIYATLTGLVTDQSQAVVAGGEGHSEGRAVRLVARHRHRTPTAILLSPRFPSAPTSSPSKRRASPPIRSTGIVLNGGDKRNVDAQLTLGATSANGGNHRWRRRWWRRWIPARKSDIITTKELQNFVQVGSNAAEFIKIMPGFGIQNGTSNKANYTGETIGINANGDAGSQSPLNNAYSYNGLPSNSLDITADGAHVSDPGCNCDTPVNPNSDMISEIQGEDVELQRREPEGAGGDHFGRQVGRQGFPRFGLLLCPELRAERQ